MSDNKDVFKSALSQLALAIVPHLAEELIAAVASHLRDTAPQPANDANKQTVADLAAADTAREDAAAKETPAPAPTKRGRGRGAKSDEKAAGDAQQKDEPAADAAPATATRQRRSRAAEKQTEAPKLIADNTEQAELRAQLIEDLGDLADVEAAHQRVHQALAECGANTINDVPSAELENLADKIDALFEEFFPEQD